MYELNKKPKDLGYYGLIYRMTSPSGKVYIGQTVSSLNTRIASHYTASKAKKTKIGDCLSKYPRSETLWEIIDYAHSKEELDEKEQGYISTYRSMEPEYGYNLKEGGSKGLLTEETKRKIGDKAKGRAVSEETRKKLSEVGRGKINSPETRKKMSICKTGSNNVLSKRVRCVELDVVFPCIEEAERISGIDHSSISRVCRGVSSHAGGFKWEYTFLEITNSNKVAFPVPPASKKKVEHIPTGRIFSSLQEAQNTTGISRQTLRKYCNSNHSDFKWMD
jgi:group I intron endonuclease